MGGIQQRAAAIRQCASLRVAVADLPGDAQGLLESGLACLIIAQAGNTPLDQLITDTIVGNTVTIDFLTGAGFPPSWTFFTDPGGLVSLALNGTTTGGGGTTTPEPGSASLLLAGALAAGLVALKARR